MSYYVMPRAPIGPRGFEAGQELSAILFARVVMFSAVALLNKEPARQYCDNMVVIYGHL